MRRVEREHEVHRLQVAVRKVGGQLCSARGLRSILGNVAALHLHVEAEDVLAANVDQLQEERGKGVGKSGNRGERGLPRRHQPATALLPTLLKLYLLGFC